MDLSDKTILALTVVRKFPGIRPREFAEKMWPNSEGWSTYTPCGPKGMTHGGGMNLAGGAFLGKLRKRGFVVRVFNGSGYKLTAKGEANFQ